MNIQCKKIENTSEFIDAIRIRVEVYIKEQGCEPGWDPDENDKTADQYVAIVDGKIVCTARSRTIHNNEIKIECMATLKEFRKEGIAKTLMEFILHEIKKQSPKRIWLCSQVQAQPFYEKLGFKAITEPENKWGIDHVDMEYQN